MPYRTFVFQASTARVAKVMGKAAGYWDIEKIWRVGIADEENWNIWDRCHIQGLTHCEDVIVTSCMTKGFGIGDDARQEGFLQFYEYRGIHQFEDDYHNGEHSPALEVHNQLVQRQPWPHAVNGQAIRGTTVENAEGIQYSAEDGQFIFAVGSEPSDPAHPEPPERMTKVQVFDKTGRELEELATFLPDGFACGAFFSYRLPPYDTIELCLLILDNASLSLLHYPWDGTALRFGKPVTLIDGSKLSQLQKDELQKIITPQYQAINAYYCEDNGSAELFLMATHGRWMDTFRMDITVNELGKHRLILDKIAKAKYPHKTIVDGIFAEGVGIQVLENNKMRVWCAPYDYRAGRCSTAFDEIKCTHLWYFERDL